MRFAIKQERNTNQGPGAGDIAHRQIMTPASTQPVKTFLKTYLLALYSRAPRGSAILLTRRAKRLTFHGRQNMKFLDKYLDQTDYILLAIAFAFISLALL